ncbi:MAG: hypothetical protein ABFC90_07330 [Bacteroidales bacterium]|nr:hypothetical protein [Bacteroidales bacterium]
MKTKQSFRLSESDDLIINELSDLLQIKKSTVFQVIIDLQIKQITDNEGNLLKSVLDEIRKYIQHSGAGSDSEEL